MRIIGLDVGDARTGVAVTDELGLTAQGVCTVKMTSWNRDADEIKRICDRYGTDRVVCGLPLNMDGSEGPRAELVRKFSERLTKLGLNVEFADERLTTVRVTRTLIDADVRREKRRDVVDMLAAQEILQSYMDAAALHEDTGEGPTGEEQEYYEGVFHMTDDRDMELNEGELVFEDENGEEVRFTLLEAFEYNDKKYICLAPMDEETDDDEDGLVILRVQNDENGEEVYVTIDDDDELDDVYEKYLEIAEADEDDDK